VLSLTGFGLHRATRHDVGAAVSYDPTSRQLTFTLPRFTGADLSSASLVGRPVVVNFYASWCTVCRQEMPDFERLSREVDGRVAVIGVNPQTNDDDDAQAALVEQTGVTYPTVRDRDDRLLRVFDPSGALPTTVFLDATGRVERVVNGRLTEGQLTRVLAADFGIKVTHTLPDRSAFRTGPPTPVLSRGRRR
jgi:thiol-disulfide isomerase/thioredoxin